MSFLIKISAIKTFNLSSHFKKTGGKYVSGTNSNAYEGGINR